MAEQDWTLAELTGTVIPDPRFNWAQGAGLARGLIESVPQQTRVAVMENWLSSSALATGVDGTEAGTAAERGLCQRDRCTGARCRGNGERGSIAGVSPGGSGAGV